MSRRDWWGVALALALYAAFIVGLIVWPKHGAR